MVYQSKARGDTQLQTVTHVDAPQTHTHSPTITNACTANNRFTPSLTHTHTYTYVLHTNRNYKVVGCLCVSTVITESAHCCGLWSAVWHGSPNRLSESNEWKKKKKKKNSGVLRLCLPGWFHLFLCRSLKKCWIFDDTVTWKERSSTCWRRLAEAS